MKCKPWIRHFRPFSILPFSLSLKRTTEKPQTSNKKSQVTKMSSGNSCLSSVVCILDKCSSVTAIGPTCPQRFWGLVVSERVSERSAGDLWEDPLYWRIVHRMHLSKVSQHPMRHFALRVSGLVAPNRVAPWTSYSYRVACSLQLGGWRSHPLIYCALQMVTIVRTSENIAFCCFWGLTSSRAL